MCILYCGVIRQQSIEIVLVNLIALVGLQVRLLLSQEVRDRDRGLAADTIPRVTYHVLKLVGRCFVIIFDSGAQLFILLLLDAVHH